MSIKSYDHAMDGDAQRASAKTEKRSGSAHARFQDGLGLRRTPFLVDVRLGKMELLDVYAVERLSQRANDAICALQVADDAVAQFDPLLGRMRELLIWAGSAALDEAAREEFMSLQTAWERITDLTRYRDHHLLNGTSGGLTYQTGLKPTDTITIAIDNLSAGTLGIDQDSLDLEAAPVALGSVECACERIEQARAQVSAISQQVVAIVGELQSDREGLAVAESRIMAMQDARAIATSSASQITKQAERALRAQANATAHIALTVLS